MTTKAYLIWMLILVIMAIMGGVFVHFQGETPQQISERLIKFVPAVFVFTVLWYFRKKTPDLEIIIIYRNDSF